MARDSVQLYRRMPSPPQRQLAYALSVFGTVLIDRADYAGAALALEEAVNLMRMSFGKTHPTTLVALRNLAVVWGYRGKVLQSRSCLSRDCTGAARATRPRPPQASLVRSTTWAQFYTLSANTWRLPMRTAKPKASRDARSRKFAPERGALRQEPGASRRSPGKVSGSRTLMTEALVIERGSARQQSSKRRHNAHLFVRHLEACWQRSGGRAGGPGGSRDQHEPTRLGAFPHQGSARRIRNRVGEAAPMARG